MPAAADIVGEVFGRLTAIRSIGSESGNRLWECKCSCGESVVVTVRNLRSGNSTSCGCVRNEKTVARNTTHGLADSPEYSIWCAVKKRCTNPNDKHFDDYGGRGIQISPEWKSSFEAFHRDMGPRPSAKHSIERRDPNGDYGPDNCHWATAQEQARNRRNTRTVTFQGTSMSLAELAERERVDYHHLKYRLNKGLTPEDAIQELRK